MSDTDGNSTDGIHARLEAAEMARQRERIRARQYLDIAEVMMVALDRDGRVTLANRKACQVLGHELGDLLRADWFETCIPKRQRQSVWEVFTRLINRTESVPERSENLVITKSGEERLIAWSNTVITDEAGRVEETLSSGEDVTEARRAESELREREAELSGIYASVPVTLMLVDDDRRVRRINPLGAAPLDRSPEELVGQRGGEALRCIHHLDDPRGCGYGDACAECEVRRVVMASLQQRKPHCGVEARLQVERDGQEQTLELLVSTTPLTIESEPLVLVSVQDITALKQTQQRLRDSEEKYQELFELGLEAVFLIDNETGRIQEANNAACDMYGYSRPALLQMRNEDLSAEEEQTQQATRTSKGSVVVPLRHHRRENGDVFPVEITGRFFELKGRSVHVAAIRDLTARHNLEEQLRHAQKMESVGRLAGGVAHDFNNLLTVILASAELMALQLRPSDPLLEDLKEIQDAGHRAEALTSQLLAFSRRQVLQPRVLSLPELVGNLERMLRRLIGEDIALRCVTAADTWPVRADRGLLESILVNLAVNARDAMPRGGKLTLETANVRLDDAYIRDHTGMTPGEYALLAVTDSGCGMDAETQTRAFEPFFTTKGKETGTGLGLAMVYGIVRQHGGFIWLYSEPGIGTTIKIYLPRVVAPDDVEGAEAQARTATAPTAPKGETVLVVEDEGAVRRLVVRMLTQRGYKVLEASDGLAAETVDRQCDGPIHLLLTDVIMPGRSGKQTVEQLCKTRPDMKVLYMSGYTDNAIVHLGELEPGTRFLQKPFSAEELARRVREALDE